MKKAKLNIETISVDELLKSKAEYNPREINAEQKNGLRKSLESFGYVSNLIYNKTTGNLVSGHQRLDILKEDGMEEVDVNVVELSLEDEKKLNILMNSQAIVGDFTKSLNDMLEEIMDIDPEMFDTTNMGTMFISEKEAMKGIEDEEDNGIVKGMDLLPYESYDCVLIVCKRRDDFMYLSSKLKLGEKRIISSPSVKNKKLGYTRCVDGKEIIELLGQDTSKNEEEDNEEYKL